jgi:PRC-barrel domain
MNTASPDFIPAGRCDSAPVFGVDGEKIGTLEGVAIDAASGEITFAVVGEGGLLGLGSRRHSLPWAALDYDPRSGGYVAPIDRRAFAASRRVAAVSRAKWPGVDSLGGPGDILRRLSRSLFPVERRATAGPIRG